VRRAVRSISLLLVAATVAVLLAVASAPSAHGEDPAPAPAPTPRSFTIMAVGDVLAHPGVTTAAARYGRASQQRYDYRPMFVGVAPLISRADLAICHLEAPIAPPGQRFTGYPVFGTPPEVVQGVASAGFDRCSVASNHSIDRGTAGIDATLNTLDAYGVGHSGTARTPEEAATLPIITVNGVRVAHLSYTFGLNGSHLPKGQPWRVNLIDPARIVADARTARAAGAEYVVVSLHWGVDGASWITAYQRTIADQITRDGQIDLILGAHPHLLQPISQVNGTWVVWSMGNFLTNMGGGGQGPRYEDGAVFEVRITERPGGGFATVPPVVHPTWVQRGGVFLVRPVQEQLADPAQPMAIRLQLAASLARTRRVLGPFLAP
jgi:poly-gamma-glutamate synthesis protein (capsule biosynthesis protein)